MNNHASRSAALGRTAGGIATVAIALVSGVVLVAPQASAFRLDPQLAATASLLGLYDPAHNMAVRHAQMDPAWFCRL